MSAGHLQLWHRDQAYHNLVSRARQSGCVRGEKEHLVILERFSWTSPEFWQHQWDCRTFNNCIYFLYWSHDRYFQTRARMELRATCLHLAFKFVSVLCTHLSTNVKGWASYTHVWCQDKCLQDIFNSDTAGLGLSQLSLMSQTFGARVGGERTPGHLDRFSWTSPECWWHQWDYTTPLIRLYEAIYPTILIA